MATKRCGSAGANLSPSRPARVSVLEVPTITTTFAIRRERDLGEDGRQAVSKMSIISRYVKEKKTEKNRIDQILERILFRTILSLRQRSRRQAATKAVLFCLFPFRSLTFISTPRTSRY